MVRGPILRLAAPVAVMSLLLTTEGVGGSPPPPRTKGLDDMPLHFEVNRGQTDPRVRFMARGKYYAVFLTPDGAVLTLRKPGGPPEVQGAVLRMKWIGGDPEARVEGLEALRGQANYFRGSDPDGWITGLPTYARIRARGVYPGVDLVYYGDHGRLEFDFVVAPRADPAPIAIGFEGADRVEVDARGDLVVEIAGGTVRQHRPVVYQEVGGIRREISGAYVLQGDDRVGFRVGAHDPAIPLVIDPILVYSTFLGGTGDENVWRSDPAGGISLSFGGIAVDDQGQVYVAGPTTSTDFPTSVGPYPNSESENGLFYDLFVAKLNPEGNDLVYSTYLGGSGHVLAYDLAVDSDGNAYVTGDNESPLDFPRCGAPLQAQHGGGVKDAFLTKLDPNGQLLYSTYIGGAEEDQGYGIDVDDDGIAYVAGETSSTTFTFLREGTGTPAQATFAGGKDVFLVKIDTREQAQASPVYFTYLGGAGSERLGPGCAAIDAAGCAYVTGQSDSADMFDTALKVDGFPTPYQARLGDGAAYNAFVAKLNPDGAALAYGTYLGGTSASSGLGIAVDDRKSAYVVGRAGFGFPTATGWVPGRYCAGDGFVAKLTPDGSGLVYALCLGGSVEDGAFNIAVDGSRNAYVTGFARSPDFPLVKPFQRAFGGIADAFVAKIDAAGSDVLYSSFLGGSGEDAGTDIAVDAYGNAYVTGATASEDFCHCAPAQPGYDRVLNDGSPIDVMPADAFVVKVAPPPACAPMPRPPLLFSGYKWVVKSSTGPMGPQGNYWSSSWEDVWVDPDGKLHLKIRWDGIRWVCSEIYTVERTRPGLHRVVVETKLDDLDPNAVFGFFAYLDDCNEIDIECSRWGDPSAQENLQYGIQPTMFNPECPGASPEDNHFAFPMDLSETSPASTHSFEWHPDPLAPAVTFESIFRNGAGQQDGRTVVTTDQDIPSYFPDQPYGNPRVHINFWLNGCVKKLSDPSVRELEVVIASVDLPIPRIPVLTAPPPEEGRDVAGDAIYVWRGPAFNGTPIPFAEALRLAEFCAAKGIRSIFYDNFGCGQAWDCPEGGGVQGDGELAANIHLFHAYGLRVEALYSDTTRLWDVVEYNARVPEEARFDGIHLDVESGSFPCGLWPGGRSEPSAAADLRVYSEAVAIAGTGGLPVYVDIGHHWGSDPNEEDIEYEGETKEAYKHVLDIVDGIDVATTQDNSGDPTVIERITEDEVCYGMGLGKPVHVTLETYDVVDRLDLQNFNTFFDEGEDRMKEVIAGLTYPGVACESPAPAGFAYHFYRQSYGSPDIPLWQWSLSLPDDDRDGILDAVDEAPAEDSLTFSDGTTSGSLPASQGLSFLVRDSVLPAPDDGILIVASGDNPAPAEIGIPCEPAGTIVLDPGESAVVTCGSLRVLSQRGKVVLDLGDGVMVEVPVGLTARVTEVEPGRFRVENASDIAGEIAIAANGETVAVSPLAPVAIIIAEDGTITVDDADADRDGFPNLVDSCGDSDLSPTVVIDGRDSGVANSLLGDGCTISDRIAGCAAGARNHGAFVSCVADLTDDLKRAGIITGEEKGEIMSCAAKGGVRGSAGRPPAAARSD